MKEALMAADEDDEMVDDEDDYGQEIYGMEKLSMGWVAGSVGYQTA